VSLPSFYSWKRRLAGEALDGATAPASSQDTAPRLLPVRVPPASAALELVLPGGVVVRISAGCDFALLRCLLDALGDPPC
jgi:hypothetical protein